MPRRGAHRTRAPLVASDVPPDVEGGILPPGRKALTFLRVVEFLSGCGRKRFFPPRKMHGSMAGRRPAATGAVPEGAPDSNSACCRRMGQSAPGWTGAPFQKSIPAKALYLKISRRFGIDVCAPGRMTQMAAAVMAKRIACSMDLPSATVAANVPEKQSPAPTVSTALTLGAGNQRGPAALLQQTPRAPQVARTCFTPSSRNRRV